MTPGGVDPWQYRRVVGHFPTGVALVSTVADGVDHVTTVSSLTSVSLDPVLVLCSVERVARFHDAVLAAGFWAVSVLGEDAEAASRHFARRGRSVRHQLAGWTTRPGPVTGAALFAGALAELECRTWATYAGGDHTIVVGEVLRAEASPRSGPPLVYHRGHYARLAPAQRSGSPKAAASTATPTSIQAT